jgi:hypothetical protein
MDESNKSMMERMLDAAEAAVARMQQEVSQSPVVSATKERAQAVRDRAQSAATTQFQLASADDVARLQASLDRIEAAVNDIARELRDARPTSAPGSGQLQAGLDDDDDIEGPAPQDTPPVGPT